MGRNTGCLSSQAAGGPPGRGASRASSPPRRDPAVDEDELQPFRGATAWSGAMARPGRGRGLRRSRNPAPGACRRRASTASPPAGRRPVSRPRAAPRGRAPRFHFATSAGTATRPVSTGRTTWVRLPVRDDERRPRNRDTPSWHHRAVDEPPPPLRAPPVAERLRGRGRAHQAGLALSAAVGCGRAATVEGDRRMLRGGTTWPVLASTSTRSTRSSPPGMGVRSAFDRATRGSICGSA